MDNLKITIKQASKKLPKRALTAQALLFLFFCLLQFSVFAGGPPWGKQPAPAAEGASSAAAAAELPGQQRTNLVQEERPVNFVHNVKRFQDGITLDMMNVLLSWRISIDKIAEEEDELFNALAKQVQNAKDGDNLIPIPDDEIKRVTGLRAYVNSWHQIAIRRLSSSGEKNPLRLNFDSCPTSQEINSIFKTFFNNKKEYDHLGVDNQGINNFFNRIQPMNHVDRPAEEERNDERGE